jgi:hypothetical protein
LVPRRLGIASNTDQASRHPKEMKTQARNKQRSCFISTAAQAEVARCEDAEAGGAHGTERERKSRRGEAIAITYLCLRWVELWGAVD